MLYGFVLVPDCTKLNFKCLKYRASEARKKYVAPNKLLDIFALTFLVLPCVLLQRTLYM